MNKGGKDGEDIFASPKVVEVSDRMIAYQQELGYKPTKFIFEPITQSRPGLYTKHSDCKPETAETLKDMLAGCIELEQLIQQLYFLSEDKQLRQFRHQNPIQKTLREELQSSNEIIAALEAENKKLKDIMSKNDTNNREMDDQSGLISKLQQKVSELTLEKDELLRMRKESASQIQELNRKYLSEKEAAT